MCTIIDCKRVAVQGAVHHHVLQRFAVPGGADNLIFVALEMAVFSRLDGAHDYHAFRRGRTPARLFYRSAF